MDENIKCKSVFVVMTNTDLTEGRGAQIPIAICETHATGIRKAKGAGVMGSDASVLVFPAIFHAGSWCAPFQMVTATEADKKSQIAADARESALRKAKDAGLSDEDIRALIGIKP